MGNGKKKSLNHTEISGEIHLTGGEKKDRTSGLAILFPKILLKTPTQTIKINEVKLYQKGTKNHKQSKKKHDFSSNPHKTVKLVTSHL